MENPEKGITKRSERRIDWVSNTTGDDDGVDVTLSAPVSAVLRLRTPIISLDVPLSDLADGATKAFPADGVDLRAFMRRLPECDLTRQLAIDVMDDAPPSGICAAYWLRATQEDGAQAWTSPVYLDVER
jgi:hypothetical protein